MPARTDELDLGRLNLQPGEARRLDVTVEVHDFSYGGERYAVAPQPLDVRLDVARMTGNGFSLRLRASAGLAGPCMRCLADARPELELDAREVDQPGGGDELDSPYVRDARLDLHGWARDALALALPQQVVCRADCAGLCPVCGEDLNLAGEGHGHERAPDPRWARLSELRFE
jgi:uncharacterized protein